jgi:hypothetical protein
MCKEMPVIPVKRDTKRIIVKIDGQRGGEAQGVAGQKKIGSRPLAPGTLV